MIQFQLNNIKFDCMHSAGWGLIDVDKDINASILQHIKVILSKLLHQVTHFNRH